MTETSAPLVTCLQPTDLSQHISDTQEDDIFCVAPAEQNRPQSIQDKESLAFPTLFPDGKQIFNESRPVKLSLSQYVKNRLFAADGRFAKNPEYLFYLQYLKEFNEVLSSARISLRKGSGNKDVTVGELTTAAHLRQMVHKNEGYKFLAKVRGSAPYWEKTLRDLCAMVKQLGIPTWFASFSAADRRWPEIVTAILKLEGKDVPETMDWTEHCKVINSNPVVAAAMFDKRANHLIKELIMSAAQPIGDVVDYFYRIEFQQRGWPHIHALFWVKDAPCLPEDPVPEADQRVVDLIDKYVTCRVPVTEDPDLLEKVTSLQTHSKRHTKSCRKGNKTCRFNFPRPPSTRTFICRPIACPSKKTPTEWKAQAKKKLEKFWDIVNSDECPNLSSVELLRHAGLTQDELEIALGRMATKVSIVMKREPNECWTNQYNKHLLRGWNANIDIQFVVNAYSCICYILSYISKKESEEGELLKAAQKDAREGNKDAVKELWSIGQVYVTHREVSIMEAIWRATGMKLKSCSREVIWIPADDQSAR